MANPMIVSPALSQVTRRSKPAATGFTPVSGRWVTLDATGKLVAPAAGGSGYLVYEGLKQVARAATFAAGGTGNAFYVPSALVDLPSAVASNEAAIATGVFVYQVGPEGYTVAVAAASPGALLYLQVDAAIPGGAVLGTVNTGGTSPAVAILENVSGTTITVRTLANA